MNKITKTLLIAAVASPLLMVSAGAHHSNGMFDMTKELEITGTVKAWQYMAPHSWLQVITTGPDGKNVVWSLEGGGPSALTNYLKKDSFKAGDKVTVKTNPMRDGRPAGTLGTVTLADGTVIKNPYLGGGAAPAAAAGH